MTDREFRKYLPFTAIQDGVILSKRGDITFGWRLWLPTAFTVNEAGYDSIISTFIRAYKILPVWCVVHKQDIYRNDTFHAQSGGPFLVESYERHFDGRKYLNGYCYLYLTFSSKSVIMKKNAESGFFGLSASNPASSARIIECANFASQFQAILESNPLLVLKRLSNDDLLRMDGNGRDEGVVADYLRLYDDDGPDFSLEFYRSSVHYGEKLLKVWYVEDSDAYPGRVSSVQQIGEMSSTTSKVFLSGGSPVGYQLRIPHIVNRYILTLPKSLVEGELDQRKRLMNSLSLYSQACAVNSAELQNYLVAAAASGTTTVKCFMDVMAWGLPEEMPDIRNQIVSAFSSKLSLSVVEEGRVAPLLHYAAIPGAAAELGYDNYLNSEITAFCCHGLWDGYDSGMKNGVLRLCDRDCLVPIHLDIQSIARSLHYINNMNALVVGPSGTGKSFTMNKLVQDFYYNDEHIVIIDIGDSYQVLCQVIREESGGKDGVYNTYDPEHPFGFNPFKGRSHWNEVDEDGESSSSGYEFLMSLFKTIYRPEGGWTNEASSILKNMLAQFFAWWDNGVPESICEDLKDAYANERRIRAERTHRKVDEASLMMGYRDAVKEIFIEGKAGRTDPVFNDFYLFVTRIVAPLMNDDNYLMGDIKVTPSLFNVSRFSAAMDMYKKDGIYGYLLNAEEEADLFQSRLTVFEVDKIKDNSDLFPIWVLCIVHSFEDKMRSLPCQKVLILEEAWSAIATESMAKFIVWMWRTARKFRTSAVVVTQDINDLIGSEIVKDAIIQNSDVRILLDQRKNANNFENAVKVLGLSPMAKNLILSVNGNLNPKYIYKEAFFSIGQNYCNVFGVEVSPEQAIAFETDKTEKEPLIRRAGECGSIIQAIREMVQENRANKKNA